MTIINEENLSEIMSQTARTLTCLVNYETETVNYADQTIPVPQEDRDEQKNKANACLVLLKTLISGLEPIE